MNFSGNQAMKSGSCSSSRGGDVDVEDKFPEGLRVLVVDDDPTCLRILEKMLQNCLYKVTTCNRAEVALEFLRENKNGYDIVMSDVHMPDMDGFKLLEHIGLEMDLPVIMMSADDGKKVVMKGITHGACDYLIKPVRMEALKNIWQHVVRKKKHEKKDKNVERSESLEDGEPQQNQSEDFDNSSSANEGNLTGCKKKRDEDEETDDKEDSSTMKKPRVVWSVELHQQFVAAVNTLGIDKAVPKKILEMMNVPGLSRENVASHLQKYRLYLRRLSDMSQHPSGLNTSFLSSPEAAFGSVPLALELQALASSGQLSSERLASLHAAAFNRQGTSALSMPLTDERSLFSFESQRLGNVQQEVNNNSKQLSLLQGIPTNMEPRKLANLHSAQPFLRMNGSSQVNQNYSGFMQMTQLQSRGQVLNQTNGSQVPIIHSSNGQTLLSSAIPRVWTPNGVGGTSYTHVSQGSSVGAFSMKQRSELPGTTFPLMSNPGMASLSSKPVYHREVNTETKDPQNFRPGYDLISGHHIQQIPDWRQQNVGSNFHASQRLASQGVCGQQDFRGENINLPVNQGLFSVGGGQNNTSSMNPLNPVLADTSMVKSETLTNPDSQSNLFSESYGHDDLMSFLLKQPQDDIIPVDHDFGFNGYSLDNLSS